MSSLVVNARKNGFTVLFGLLAAVLALSFYQVFLPGYNLASNDAPLARISSHSHSLPERFSGCWQDLNSVGVREPAAMPDLSYALLYVLGPVGFSKFYAPFALLLAGLSAWYFFRRLGISPAAAVLGGLAVPLNSTFFSTACWGIAGHVIAVGMTFLAMGLLLGANARGGWGRAVLAGLAVGMAVTEAADVGAILSMLVAAFAMFLAWTAEGARLKNLLLGAGRVMVVAVCAGVVSAQLISEIVATEIVDMAAARTTSQLESSKWDWATQWSLPKTETLGLIVPGLFGFRTDTPDGGGYWGTVGRDANWDAYDANGRQGPTPVGFARYNGSGIYAGVLVVLLAAWAFAQSWRKEGAVFAPGQRRWLCFWGGTGGVCLLLGYGRYAPFYRLVFDIPYFSLIRNPVKFLDVLSIALVVLFAYGVDGLWRRNLEMSASATPTSRGQKPAGPTDWAFNRRWLIGCSVVLGLSVAGWWWYSTWSDKLQQFMYNTEFNPPDIPATVAFSIRQVGWYVLFLGLGIGALWAIMSGMFARKWATGGAVLLGLLLVADLALANRPWVVFWHYSEIYASNPIVDELRKEPYEHRVAILPLKTQSPRLALFDKVYSIVWKQGLFPYYNIQNLDIVQMSRMPEELVTFDSQFKLETFGEFSLFLRHLQLTDTPYLLGPTSSKDTLAAHGASGQEKLKIVKRFNLQARDGETRNVEIGELTAVPAENGDYALFKVDDVLPRARLYSHWQVNTNDAEVLNTLKDPGFDPAAKVLVSTTIDAAPVNAGDDAGTTRITKYSPRDIVLACDAHAADVLLLNDRLDPNWKVTVDSQPARLLRCNYLMRGVQVGPGIHTVEFRFTPPDRAIFISFAGIIASLAIGCVVLVTSRKKPSPIAARAVKPSAGPEPAPVAILPRAAVPEMTVPPLATGPAPGNSGNGASSKSKRRAGARSRR